MKIYLDNAATTALDERVLEKMLPFLTNEYGNPSSIHSAGRTSRLAIEESRKTVSQLLACKPAEIFFTSCGTESTNTVLQSAVRSFACKHIITSPIEHHATLNTAEELCKEFGVQIHFAKHHSDGTLDYDYLLNLIKNVSAKGKALVSIMHANNEIGTINDIEKIGNSCKEFNVLFHCDMVQTIGHFPVQLQSLPVDFASGSGHKFHGPKGNGILYVNANHKVTPFLLGGGQERNMRAGTENVVGIVGLAAALELAIAERDIENKLAAELKTYTWEKIQTAFPEVELNGNLENSLPRILSLSLPHNENTEMLQMSLDIKGIAISGGSACSSGALGGSHVINHIKDTPCVPLRISFCKWNSKEEIDYLLKSMIAVLA